MRNICFKVTQENCIFNMFSSKMQKHLREVFEEGKRKVKLSSKEREYIEERLDGVNKTSRKKIWKASRYDDIQKIVLRLKEVRMLVEDFGI